MKERPILFSAPMIRALLDGTKTQTRRVVNGVPPCDDPSARWTYCVDSTDRASIGMFSLSVLDTAGKRFTERGREHEVAQVHCPYGAPGDRLWVRETWYCDHFECTGAALRTPTPAQRAEFTRPDMLIYRADGTCCEQFGECDHSGGVGSPWRPSIHMPRWASRITLEVTGVRVERLQDISEADAKAEGVERSDYLDPLCEDDEYWECYREGCDCAGVTTARAAYETLWAAINGADSWAANPWVWRIEFRMVTP